MKSISQYLNGRVPVLGTGCCRFKSCLADSLGRSFNGRKSRLHRDNGSSILPRSNATVAQWQCISFVKSRLSVRLRPVAPIFTSGLSIWNAGPAKAGWLSSASVVLSRAPIPKPTARYSLIFHSGNSIGRVPVFQTGCCEFDPRPLYFGRLAERLIAPVLKTGVGQTTAGSNPAPSDVPLVQRIEHLPSKQRILVRFQEGAPPCCVIPSDPNEPEGPDEPDDESDDDYFNPDDSNTWLQEKGPLAQWSEQSPHKGLVVGSNPTGPTFYHHERFTKQTTR